MNRDLLESNNEQSPNTEAVADIYFKNTYTIVSTVAYLLGVPEKIFKNEFGSPQLEIFERLEKEKSARIIRNLCMLRTAIERNFGYINEKMTFEYKGLMSMPELIPVDAITQLGQDHINIVKTHCKPVQYIIDILSLIHI